MSHADFLALPAEERLKWMLFVPDRWDKQRRAANEAREKAKRLAESRRKERR